jgi:drug/metabolite transporter (DMT)-like permease
MSEKKTWLTNGIAAGLASAALFGMSTPLAKVLLGNLSPLMLAGLLYAGSGLGLGLILIVRRANAATSSELAFPQRREWGWLAGAILFGGVLGPALLMYGLAASAASTASLLLNLEGVLTALLAWFVFGENFDRRIALGMVAIIAGGAVLAWSPGDNLRASHGLLLIVAACLCWAIDNNLTRKVSASDAMVIACSKGLVAALVNVSLALLAGHTLPTPTIALLAMMLGLLGYGISLVLFVIALRHLGTARAGAYFSVAPFFGAALAVAIQHEPVTMQLGAAAILMGAGVWLHVTERHEHAHRHEALEHDHPHIHDAHHRHEHALPWDGNEPHRHPHRHDVLVHSHPHFPDVDHRHSH